MNRHTPPARKFAHITLVIAILLITLALLPWTTYSQGKDYATIQQVWQQATQYGTFHYATTLEQTIQPSNTLDNVGLSHRVDRSYIEGEVNRADATMHMRMWSNGGRIAAAQGLELRVENGKTYGRIAGSAWEETEAIHDLFAPDNDPLSYLVAARNVTYLGETQRVSMDLTHYTFDLDGPAFAEYMRQLMNDHLHQHGSLPPSITLETADGYLAMTGQDEMWVNAAGLPVRQIIFLTFPQDSLQQAQVKAVLTTDFSQWQDQSPRSWGWQRCRGG